MGLFSEYIKSILTVGLCAFLCKSVANSFGKANSNTKALSLIINLCVFIVSISPLFSFFKDYDIKIPEIGGYEIAAESEFTLPALTKEELERQVTAKIFEITNIKINETNIDLVFNENSVTIDKISASVKDENEAAKVITCIEEIFEQQINTEITVKKDE